MVPVSLLPYAHMAATLANLPISDGILPLRLFEYNDKPTNDTISPIEVGILPFNLLLTM
jgi:hypothetical protein